MQAETASIYERMAAVTRTIGDKREAEGDYQSAQEIYKKLLDARPINRSYAASWPTTTSCTDGC